MQELIYVIDDEKRIRDLLELYLKKEGYYVSSFESSKGVIEKIKVDQPACIILDIMMEGKDGLDLCKEIREISDIPIIFVSARNEEIDRIIGLEIGADDYLAKPFSPRELMIRIQNILRRLKTTSQYPPEDIILTACDFTFNPSRRIAKVKGDEINLTIKELDVIEYLLKNKNMPLSREQIISEVWGYNYDGYDRSVDDTIKRLRKKLQQYKSDLEIKTVWGYGYRIDDERKK